VGKVKAAGGVAVGETGKSVGHGILVGVISQVAVGMGNSSL
jgi:hypothetical protein